MVIFFSVLRKCSKISTLPYVCEVCTVESSISSLFIYLQKLTNKDASYDASGFVNLFLIALASFSTAYNVVLYIIYNPSFSRAINGVLRCQTRSKGKKSEGKQVTKTELLPVSTISGDHQRQLPNTNKLMLNSQSRSVET